MVREMIQKTLDYVDSNIKEDITAEELAEVAGYSVFHFYRLFQSAVGIPVMQYVLRRKLLYVIYEIGLGRKKNDVVYDYGFETYSGFYRAFIREIGYTPAQYLREYKAKRPYKINIFQEEHIMVSNKLISEVLVNWGLQDEKVSDIVFPENGEISDSAKYVGSNMVIKYTANLGSVKKAIEISRALNNVGLTAPEVIPTTDGKEYATVGELYFTLTQKVEGERVMASKLYLDAPSIFGCPWREVLDKVTPQTNEVIHSLEKPLFNEPGLKVLHGNISPKGAIVRPTAVYEEVKHIKGPAKVFDNDKYAFDAIMAGNIVPGDIMVVRYEGCKGAPGMKELRPQPLMVGSSR